MKTTFRLEANGAYPNIRGTVNIIGERPENIPYVSISFQQYGNEIASSWVKESDLELFAVNILKALNSKRLSPPKTNKQ